MVKKFYEVRACFFTGEDGIGGVVTEPSYSSFFQFYACVQDVGMGAEFPTIRTVSTIVRSLSKGS
jgi:hypothetical protein